MKRKRKTSAKLVRAYLESRKDNVSAHIAYRWAKSKLSRKCKGAIEWDNDEKGHCKRNGFDVLIRVRPEEYADLGDSGLGTFSDKPAPGAIKLHGNARFISRSTAYDYFVPDITADEHRRGLNAMGYSRGVADEMAREYVRRDMERAREWHPVYVVVKAFRAGVELGSDSLGMCDIDSLDDLESIVLDHDMIGNAIEEARKTLESLCCRKGKKTRKTPL